MRPAKHHTRQIIQQEQFNENRHKAQSIKTQTAVWIQTPPQTVSISVVFPPNWAGKPRKWKLFAVVFEFVSIDTAVWVLILYSAGKFRLPHVTFYWAGFDLVAIFWGYHNFLSVPHT